MIDLSDANAVRAHRPFLIAHRGGVIAPNAPECSLAAIRLAATHGYREEIAQQAAEDPDVAPILDKDFWDNARLVVPEVIDWYKSTYGKKYQIRIFDILRQHME